MIKSGHVVKVGISAIENEVIAFNGHVYRDYIMQIAFMNQDA